MENSFLSLVAKHLFETYGDNLSDFIVVFPNKRAGKFLNEQLYGCFQRPFKAPQYSTISEMVAKSSDRTIADELELLYLLYTIFLRHLPSHSATANAEEVEPFDHFYAWGKIILSDFDDIDKNLADPVQLFRNIDEYKSYDRLFDFLTEEQRQLLARFFNGVQMADTGEIQRNFLSIWNVLLPIYTEFNAALLSRKKAYEGIIYRQMVERLQRGDYAAFPHPQYVFIGFNVLNAAETALFTFLKQSGQALFYWDYDLYYLQNAHQEAGVFMRENLLRFPSLLSDPKHFQNIQQPFRQARIISTSGKTMQARFLSSELTKIYEQYSDIQQRDLAIVLGDETILPSVLHALPTPLGGKETKVNITMGFPFGETPLCSLINLWKNYQLFGIKGQQIRLKYLQPLLEHPYLQSIYPETAVCLAALHEENKHFPQLSELQLPFLFLLEDCGDGLALLEKLNALLVLLAPIQRQHSETLYRACLSVQRLRDFVQQESIPLSKNFSSRLIDSVLRSIIVPLEGDPIEGLQIMGILETRNLDFKHLILLSMNEGVLPKINSDSSFIPFSIRRAFHLNTSDRKIAVFAYYFFRLIQRCESVTFLYDSATSFANTGEMSRFLQQLRVESGWKIDYVNLSAPVHFTSAPEIAPRNSLFVQEKLRKYTTDHLQRSSQLSPSAINTYINCPLQFYFKYILNLRSAQLTEEHLTAAEMGTVFHFSAELLYKHLTKQDPLAAWDASQTYAIEKTVLTSLLSHQTQIKQFVHQSLNAVYFDPNHRYPLTTVRKLTTLQRINEQAICEYLTRLIEHDIAYAPFVLIGIEHLISGNMKLSNPSQTSVCLGGRVDRIDCKDGVLRIVDYKTGGAPKAIRDVASLFSPSANRNDYGFQIMQYACIIDQNKSLIGCDFQEIAPTIIHLNHKQLLQTNDHFEVRKQASNLFDQSKETFQTELQKCLERLFRTEDRFEACEDKTPCNYCDFKAICRT